MCFASSFCFSSTLVAAWLVLSVLALVGLSMERLMQEKYLSREKSCMFMIKKWKSSSISS